MVWSHNDDVVKPPESGKFSMYETVDNKLIVVDKVNNIIYTKDQEGSSPVLGKNYFNLLSQLTDVVELDENTFKNLLNDKTA